jgi:endonuclease YncB( thermonuclease family)
MLGRLVAILTFSRRPDCLTGPAKVIDGDTIVVAGEMIRLHGIDAPELDQTFQWRGQQIACGTMSLAALEALTAGVKVRCEVVERDRHGRVAAKVYSPNGVDIGRRLVSAGWAYRRYSMDYVDAEDEAPQGQARDVAGQLPETLGVARIVTAAAHAGTRCGYKQHQAAGHSSGVNSGRV